MTSLTSEKLRSLMSYDPLSGEFRWLADRAPDIKAGDLAGFKHSSGYWKIKVDGISYGAHRLAWLYVFGVLPKEVDHENHIGSDNRLSNLSAVSHARNMRNKSLYKSNKSGCAGVTWHKGRQAWRARIKSVSGKDTELGFYGDVKDAITARTAAQSANGYHKNHGARPWDK